MTPTEEIAARKAKYARTEYHDDELGRKIGCQRLKPSQQMRVMELTAGLDGVNEMVVDDPESELFGKTIMMSKRMPLELAASVREIDGTPIPFPKTRAELDAIFDRLDTEGVNAAGQALAKFNPPKQKRDDGTTETPEQAAEREVQEIKDAAKNSAGTASS